MMKDINEKNVEVNRLTFDKYEPPRVIRMGDGYFRTIDACGPGDYNYSGHCLNGWSASGCLTGQSGN